jgi:2,3-bisphosphoglycerate-independent phosphoglycerate mutase
MKSRKPLALVILDGWGYRAQIDANPINQLPLPTYHYLLNIYPHTYLEASGKYVGLPDAMIGNSAVGHLTIGAGKRITQPITQFLELCKTHTLENNESVKETFTRLRDQKSTVHLVGLLTDAGVHGHLQIFIELLTIAKKYNVPCMIHAILDGRDTLPRFAETLLQQLEDACAIMQWGTIASIHGRWYAMDRDMSWERIQKSVDVMCGRTKNVAHNWRDVLKEAYGNNLTDEFIPPTLLKSNGVIALNDGIIFTNTREDRARELTAAMISYKGSLRLINTDTKVPDFHVPPLSTCLTAIEYHPDFKTKVILKRREVIDTLGDYIEAARLSQFTIAETEKYAHVTYFFNGGKEVERPNETRVMITSKKVYSFDEVPEMSAPEITDAILAHLNKNPADFYLINYANADMVGHTGNVAALVKALICLDKQLEKLYQKFVVERDGILIITADHGNAEDKRIIDGMVSRKHTTNKVPLIVVQKEYPQELDCAELADIKKLIEKLLY